VASIRLIMFVVVTSVVFAACNDNISSGLPVKSGKLVVTSTPEGASIWLDGKNTNRVTPDTLEVRIGTHSVRLILKGYEDYTTTVHLVEGQTDTVDATLKLQCPGGVIGDLEQSPEVEILGLQQGDNTIRGIANNIDASIVRVVLWAKTDVWYVQPLIDSPYTVICGDGSWENWTHPWNRMIALLVDTTYVPGSVRSDHPSTDPGVIAWDEYPSPHPDRAIDFSGHTWKVKSAELADPGPNYFSDSVSNVWVDADGLHLKIEQRDGKWYCAEVFLDQSLGYGEYTFQLGSRVDSLDYNTVFAGFVYEAEAREFDIEFSSALAEPSNAQFVVQPYYIPGNINKFPMPKVMFSTHQFIWLADHIEFTSWKGLDEDPDPDSLIQSWTYAGPDIPPPGEERMRFNLWLFQGEVPAGGQGDDVVIKSFRHR
jgi:hypothetical protein